MKLSLLFLSLLLVACGSDDDESSSQVGVAAAVSTAKSVMNQIVADTSGISALTADDGPVIFGDLATYYSDIDMSIGGDFGDSPKQFLQKQGDNTAQSSLMYRFKQQVQENICMFAYFLPSTNGIPDITSETTVTITDAMIASNNGTSLSAACPDASTSGLPSRPFTVRYNVADVSSDSGTLYDRRVQFDTDNDSTYESEFHIRIAGSTTRFSYIEFPATGNHTACLFEYDSSTQFGRFEFMEDANGTTFKLLYRAILDTANSTARYLAKVVGDGENDESVLTVTTASSSATELAISYNFSESNNDNSSMPGDGDACVSNSTLNISTNNTLTCTGATGITASSFTTALSTVDNTAVTSINETSSIQFTNLTDIATAAVSQ